MDKNTRLGFFKSDDQKWVTPAWLFDRFNYVFDFKLDPCCVQKTAKCSIFFTPIEDGLKQDWNKVGNAFVNPPFSRELSKWIEKCYEESQKGIIVALLIPCRTDTIAWHKFCFPNALILFIKGRITFEDQREISNVSVSPAFFPSALVIFGDTNKYNLALLSDLGIFVKIIKFI